MMNNGSLVTVPRLTNAWEPNINTGMVYYQLEVAIMRYLYMHRERGAFVQLGEDPNDAPLMERTYIKPENIVGYIVGIDDSHVTLDLASDRIDLVWKNIMTCHVGFSYIIADVHDQMSDIRILKPILYLNPISKTVDHDDD